MELLAQILSSSFVAALVSTLIASLSKGYLDRRLEEKQNENREELEKMKAENRRLLEQHRAKVKNSESFFNRQMEACNEIHSLAQSMLPPHKFPYMDWEEALGEMISEVERVEKESQSLYTEYFSVLPDSVLNKLNAATGYAGEAKFETESGSFSAKGRKLARKTFDRLSEAATEAKELLDGQRHSLIEPHMKNPSE